MSLLSVVNIVKEYRNKPVLNSVNLTVQKGDRVALIGVNGSGKTTLLKIINGTEQADSGRVIKAHGIKTGYLTQSADIDEKYSDKTALDYEKIDLIEEDLRSLEYKMSDPDNKDEYEGLLSKYQKLLDLFNSLDGYNVTSSLAKILNGLGLKKEAFKLPLSKLSGGEKIRVALARILFENPELLILDEPTNHLDIEAVEWLESFLSTYTGGVLIVSHDRYFLDRVSTRLAELYNGTVVESKASGYSSYILQKKERREFLLNEKKRLANEIHNTKQLINDLKSRSNVGAFHSREKTLDRLNKAMEGLNSDEFHNHLKTAPVLKFRAGESVHVSAEIAYARNFSKSFGEVTLFENAEFLIRGGERVGIVGPNGSGKTTLVNILLGLDRDFKGEAVLGEWVKYAYLGQTIEFNDETSTICEEVCNSYELERKQAQTILSDYGFFGNQVDKKINILSGGEKVRLKLAMLLMNNPYCLIMDEPTNHLDADSRDELELMIANYKGTVIAVSHDRYFLLNCMNRIIEIKNYKFYSYPEGYTQYYENKKKERLKVKGMYSEDTSVVSKKGKTAYTANEIKKVEANINDERTSGVENSIILVEERMMEIEKSIGFYNDLKLFTEYGRLQKELERLYEAWQD